MNISAIILAAGKSQRFGREDKLLAHYNQRSLIFHVAQSIQAVDPISDVICVTNPQNNRAIKQQLNGFDLIYVTNEHDDGLSGSLKCGIAALPLNCDAVIIALGDMPKIAPQTIQALLDAVNARSMDGQPFIIVPEYQEKRKFQSRHGHPVIFSKHFFAEIKSLSGDRGAQSIIKDHSQSLITIPVDDANIHLDIDTPQALREL